MKLLLIVFSSVNAFVVPTTSIAYVEGMKVPSDILLSLLFLDKDAVIEERANAASEYSQDRRSSIDKVISPKRGKKKSIENSSAQNY